MKLFIDSKEIQDREELILNEFAQKAENAEGLYDELEKAEDHNIGSRNRFQRDKDRILHTRAFRTLIHKTQIFTAEKGEHFRTRLTHTLEVSQISRSIARALRLNEDLVEAIALGHDLGHTPYGHQGEKVIDLVLSGKESLSGKLPIINYGGFKHNFQSLKIIDCIEKKFDSFDGINLSWQVREGILKHTRIKRHKPERRNCEFCNKCWDINYFTSPKDLYIEAEHSVTLEGQVVEAADEIAQRASDLDDGFLNNGLITLEKLKEINEILKSIIEKRDSKKDPDVRKNVVIRDIIDYFIRDVIEISRQQMEEYERQGKLEKSIENGRHIFREKLISMSDEATKFDNDLENYITRKIVNSHDVNCDDGKAVYILKNLFKTYYANPRQMPDYILEKMTKDFLKLKEKYPDMKIINLREGDYEDVYREIATLRCKRENSDGIFEMVDFRTMSETEQEKHMIFVRTIADFISGMSDNIANDEFVRLYNP